MQRPVPLADEVTQPFWDAARGRQLALQRCQDCGRYYHPPVAMCYQCQSSELAFQPVSGRGFIYSYTIVRSGRHPAFDALQPYAVLVVEMEEQPQLFMIGNVFGEQIDEIEVGLPVEVDFDQLTPDILLPQFRIVSR